MSPDLQLFIKEALLKNLSKQDITAVLVKAGWKKKEVGSALDAFADLEFPVPVPKRRPYLSARETFLYLVMFLGLYLSAVSFGSLIFDFINYWLPDPLQIYYEQSRTGLRMSLATLIVAFPLYFWLAAVLRRAAGRDPERQESKVRKWLTYLTLFVAAGVIVGGLITLLFNLLGGELTARFLLKTLAVFAIAGTIFGYYLWNFRQEEKEQT